VDEGDQSRPIAEVTTEALRVALQAVVAQGLPVTEQTAGQLLPNLRSVYARALIPDLLLSRLQALNELLPRLVARLADTDYREATQMLFGLAPGTRGTTLTSRRRQASKLMGYSLDHFRSRIEGDVLFAVATALHEDLLRYRSRVKRATESLEPTGDTPMLGPEHFTAEEELVSRIWQHVYGLRAELIAFGRLSDDHEYASQAEDHRQAANDMQVQLRRLLTEYTSTYGKALLSHGTTELSRAAVERLAGWEL
jgi:hypothetical protein